MENSTLIAHRGSSIVTREQLRAIPAPVGSTYHKPVPHIELVDTLRDRLNARGINVLREQFAVSANGMQLFGTLDLAYAGTASMTAALGFRHANDKSLAIQIVAGARVFVCDNLALSGQATVLKRKHTRSLSLRFEVNRGLDGYFRAVDEMHVSIEQMSRMALSDSDARVVIFEMFYSGVLPVSLFDEVSRNYLRADDLGYEDSKPRNMWGLHNAATRAVKALSPASGFRHTVDLGKFFGIGSPAHRALAALPPYRGEVIDIREA